MYGNTYLTLDKLVQLACYCYVHGYIHMYGTMYGSTYLALISKWYISSMWCANVLGNIYDAWIYISYSHSEILVVIIKVYLLVLIKCMVFINALHLAMHIKHILLSNSSPAQNITYYIKIECRFICIYMMYVSAEYYAICYECLIMVKA
jgi:hypothetical protein